MRSSSKTPHLQFYMYLTSMSRLSLLDPAQLFENGTKSSYVVLVLSSEIPTERHFLLSFIFDDVEAVINVPSTIGI